MSNVAIIYDVVFYLNGVCFDLKIFASPLQ